MPFTALRVKRVESAKSAAWEIVNTNDAMLAFGLTGGMVDGSHHGHALMLYGIATDLPVDTDVPIGDWTLLGSPAYGIRFRTIESFPMIRAAVQTAVEEPESGVVNKAAAGGAFGADGINPGTVNNRFTYDTDLNNPVPLLSVRVQSDAALLDKFYIRHSMDLGGVNVYWWIIGCDVEISPRDY